MDLNRDFIWNSDYNGDEVGYPEIPVVGLYSLKVNQDMDFFFNMETLEILDAWTVHE